MNGIKIQASGVFSNRGTRPGQEDRALVLEDKRIFVVADGFGGPIPGGRAAETACESIRGFLFKEAGDLEATLPFELRSYFSLAGNVLFNALIHANGKLRKLNDGKDVHEKGGASVLAGFMDGDLLALANVGGCSAWLMRGGEQRELVVPRTYGRLCDPFAATVADSPESSGGKRPGEQYGVPLMALGMAADLQPEIFEYRVRKGDWIFFQTDGISSDLRQRLSEVQRENRDSSPAQELLRKSMECLETGTYKDNAAATLILF